MYFKKIIILILFGLMGAGAYSCGSNLSSPVIPAPAATNTATRIPATNTATSTASNTATITRTHTAPLPTVTPTPTLVFLQQILLANGAAGVASRPGYVAYDYSSGGLATSNVQVLAFSDSQNTVQTGSYTLGISNLTPGGIAIDSYNELYVAEGTKGEVNGYYLTSTGATLDYTWSGQGVLSNATGVKIDANGNLVVSDGAGIIYNLAWTNDAVLTKTTTGPTHFSPQDVALDSAGDIYAANGSYGIAEFSPTYQYTTSFTGSTWSSPLNTNSVASVGVNAQGNLAITNGNFIIYFASPQGGYLGTYGYGGDTPGYVNYDPSGNLWFSASGNNNLAVELSH